MSQQLKDFLNLFKSDYQSGYRKRHITTTDDDELRSTALFINLSKAFDTIDHKVLNNEILNIGLSHRAAGWFVSDLFDRWQCVQRGALRFCIRNFVVWYLHKMPLP